MIDHSEFDESRQSDRVDPLWDQVDPWAQWLDAVEPPATEASDELYHALGGALRRIFIFLASGTVDPNLSGIKALAVAFIVMPEHLENAESLRPFLAATKWQRGDTLPTLVRKGLDALRSEDRPESK